jgi:hypothetical protein
MIEEKRDFYIDGEWVKPFQTNDLEVVDPQLRKFVQLFLLAQKRILMMQLKLLRILSRIGGILRKKKNLSY